MLLSLALDEFLTVRSARLNQSSLHQYTWELTRLVDWCNENHVTDTEQLSAAIGARYLDFLRTNVTTRGTARSSRSLLHYAKSLRVFLRWLVAEELAPARVLRLELPKAEAKIPPTLTTEQVVALVKACQESNGPALQARDTAIVLLLLDTGMRASELCGLKVDQVKLDKDDPHVLIKGEAKGGRWREVGPLGKRTVRALKAYTTTWRTKQHPATDCLFVGRTGTALEVVALERLMARLKRRTGVDARVNPHSWRHTWARSRAVAGTDTLVISRLMGHSALQTTALYLGQFSSVDARKQVRSMVDSL
jgi:site-specific recombinase XerD